MRGMITVGVAAVAVATIAIVSAFTLGCAAPVLIGAAIGAGVSAGVSAGGQYLATDSINTGQLLTDMSVGAAIWSGFLGGVLSGITTGVQKKQFASLSKFNNRIKVCKSKGITNSYFTHAVKKSSALVRSANMAVIKSIPKLLVQQLLIFIGRCIK